MDSYIIVAGAFFLGTVIGFLICSVLKNKLIIENRVLKENIKCHDNIMELVKNEFINLANSALIEKQKNLQEQNALALDDKLKPVMERIKEFQQKVEQYNETEIKNNSSLMKEFENLQKNNKAISEEAQKLTLALTKNQNIKGAYGENILDVILTNSGMKEGVHFDKQYQTENEAGDTIRPDYVIRLPENKCIIIDSKMTLESFINYQTSENDEDLKSFKAATKARIKELASKTYEKAKKLNQPDFILLYVPIENSLSLLYQDIDLIEDAIRKNIIIIGTSSLLVTIKLINRLWAQEKRNESVELITQAGARLYETFSVFSAELKAIQDKFDDLSKLFSTMLGRFTRNNPKNPSIFSQVEILKDYGITTSKKIPEEFLETDNEAETC